MPDRTDGHEWAKTEAGYEFVQSMVPRADDKRNLMWFGWALREAFVAGAEWQEKRATAALGETNWNYIHGSYSSNSPYPPGPIPTGEYVEEADIDHD